MLGSVPDVLRLLAVPAFAWAAWRDVRTRRVPNRLWPPLLALGAVLLAWELARTSPFTGYFDRLFLIQVGISLLFVAPLGYAFWRFGAFGGADAKALITLAVLYPTYPVYFLPLAWLPALPAMETTLGVFSLTVLTNAVIVGAVAPLALAVRNAAAGRVSPAMFVARVVDVGDLPSTYGRLFETREGFTRAGLDLDALRMYLRWRGTSLAALRAAPGRHRDPGRIGETNPPGDGRVVASDRAGVAGTDDEVVDADEDVADADGEVVDASEEADSAVEPETVDVADDVADPWAAERFLAEIEGDAYGTAPATLREGLETVVERDAVWVSPGLPFIVPLFVGLVLALTYGDLLFGLLLALGVV